MICGKSFQRLGVMTEKDLLPKEAILVFGIDNKFELLDLSR